MPKCKLCGQKKEFYHELGYCDDCLEEIRSFLKSSKQRLNAWREESLEADEERRAEIASQTLAMEESLRQYEKRGVALNRKEYGALFRAIYAHCGVVRSPKPKKSLYAAAGIVCAVCLVAAVFFAVQWQSAKAECEELKVQNDQLTLSLSDLQMQLDGMQMAPGDESGEGMPDSGSMNGVAVPSIGSDAVIGGEVAQDGSAVIMG